MVNKKQIPEIKCLDHGFVRLVDHMGNDKRIVDAARVSYQQGTKAVQSDRHLIRYLLRNLHTTPFEKVRFEFHIKLPIFVARQWMRHRMASINEVSARYSVMPDEFYIPDPVRKQSNSNRQGSSDESITSIPVDMTGDVSEGTSPQEILKTHFKESYALYEDFIEAGAARELARTVLPVSLYTEFYWTVDLWNLMHFLRLRLDSHAQYEIRVFAEAIVKLIQEHCDLEYAMEAFQDYIVDKPDISKFEMSILSNLIKELVPEDMTDYELQLRIEKHINDNKDMSKREKAESKLVKLLLGSNNESEQNTEH